MRDAGLSPENLQVVLVGHVDHGKSTLLGRLYADTGTIPESLTEKVRDICERQGKPFEHAFLFDAFLEEQEQGVTIDTARTFFHWKGRRYTVIDAPGHHEFIKNMVTGAARAEAAVLVIDAGEGIREQSRRHGYLLGLLGVRQIAVAVNKMDLAGFREEAFADIRREITGFLARLGIQPRWVVPVSARQGDNVTAPSERMPWYAGPTVLGCLEGFVKPLPPGDAPLRFPIQDVYKFDARRVLAGRVESGTLRVGDRLVFSPSNKSTAVRSIEAFNVPHPPVSAAAGQCTGLTLEDQLFLERGEIASHKESPPEVSDRFRANLFWLGAASLAPGRSYLLRLATREVEMQVEEIVRVLDASTLETVEHPPEIRRHDAAEVVVRTVRPIALDRFEDLEATGRFVVVDGYDVRGGGIVTGVLEGERDRFRREARRRDLEWREGEIREEERVTRNGHQSGLVLFTGPSGSGKARLGRILERKLFNNGRQVFLLDGKNLRAGLDADIAPGSGTEAARRFGEVAVVLLRAGFIVVCVTNDIPQEDHPVIRDLVHPHPVVNVHMDKVEGAPPPAADLFFRSDADFRTAARAIRDRMEAVGILF